MERVKHMIEIKGTHNIAKIYTDTVEENAATQIEQLCNQEFVKDCHIRIMPDVHAGAGCVIGFTADLGEMVIPNIVGVDIGCGMITVELGNIDIDCAALDSVINAFVPSGKNVHEGRMKKYPDLQNLHCYRSLKKTRWIERSLGTLGGGNHFIEIDKDDDDNKYLVIHTGSRNLGKQVADHYQEMAHDILRGADRLFERQKQLIDEYKTA
jgi:RNA-splicing ligase RtcB